MKIAIVLPHFYPYVGGGEKMFYDLAKGLTEAGHKVMVVAQDVGEKYHGQMTIDGFIVRYCTWKEMFGHPFPIEQDMEDIISWCDIVHTSIFTTAPVVAKLAKKYGKPSVLTIYEARGKKWFWTDNFIKATIYYLVEQFTCRQKFSRYHAISDATKADIEKYCRRKNVRRVYLANEMRKDVIDTTFSLHDYLGIPRNERVFLYYGRPGKTKGVDVYLNAIRVLYVNNKVTPGIKFAFILGKEPANLRKQFINQVKKFNLQDVVIVKDSVDRAKLGASIMQADCVVVPSVTEGFGFSALEACQMGTALIYSDGGSLPEVAYGRCHSFKNRDYHDLAAKIGKVIEYSSDAFVQIPEKTFTYEEMLGGIQELYEEIIDK